MENNLTTSTIVNNVSKVLMNPILEIKEPVVLVEDEQPVNPANIAWVLVSTLLVFLMIPGVGYFYGGTIAYNKNKLTVLLSSFLALAVVSIEWFLWGYTLVFSSRGSKFIGNFDNVVLLGVGSEPSDLAPTIPENQFMIYQCMFAAITAALAFGSAAERSSLRVYVLFIFLWSIFVYNFVAYWVWGVNGFLKVDLGVLDFAGGTPVHVVSGFSALAYAIAVGPREGFQKATLQPNNLSNVFLGTVLIWFGWFGFNGGSELAINSRAVNAVIVTNLAACTGGLCWVITEMIIKRNFKFSLFGFCSGAIAGLVAITPAAGYVSSSSSLVFGLFAGVLCCLSCRLKTAFPFKIDDVCDVFAIHGIGGIIGGLLTGIFADNAIATMSGGIAIPGGWYNRNFMQILYQLAGVFAGACWSFIITLFILKIIDFIPFFKLRVNEKDEENGMDLVDLGERVINNNAEFNIDIEKC